jgi:hypothetical protein
MNETPTSPYNRSRPQVRGIRVYASDPSLAESLSTADVHEATLQIRWEADPDDPSRDGPRPGPVGEYLEVLDYDPASGGRWYEPCDLNDPYLLATDGHTPSDGNPQFHQQMVYAVAMKTIWHFEKALGRRVLWGPRRVEENGEIRDEYVGRLRIYPHALREANAYYSPSKKALLFGYFKAPPTEKRRHMPGSVVFTCLSYDIIAHETAHAILDGIHRRFLEPTNHDVLAFHEAFADIVALFQQFTIDELLAHQVERLQGRLSADDEEVGEAGQILGNLARQFGMAIGRGEALRQFAGTTPDPLAMERTFEPHARGALLVAAVFHAFVEIYRKRSADLWRIASQRGLDTRPGHLHADLVTRLTHEASKAAEHVMNMCIRAVDYLPPVDVTFGDFLRAVITADLDAFPNDEWRYRVAFIEAFRRWGIFPEGVRSMSVEALRWEGSTDGADGDGAVTDFGKRMQECMSGWNLRGDRRKIYQSLETLRAKVHTIIDASRSYKSRIIDGVDLDSAFEVHSIRPSRRVDADGQLVTDVVMEITQSRRVMRDGRELRFRGGCTLIFDLESGRVRYCITKDVNSERRLERQLGFGRAMSGQTGVAAVYADPDDAGEVLALVHRNIEGPDSEATGQEVTS